MKLDADCRSKNERQGPGGAAECRSPCVRARMGSSFAASRRWRMDSVDMNLAPGDVMSSYDYIVIGAGSSGCIVASRLSESGKHSVLRSDEHTSELQSLMRTSYAVFCLNKTKHPTTHTLSLNTTLITTS